MGVDEPRSDDEAAGVDDPVGFHLGQFPYLCYLPIFDGHIPPIPRVACAIYHLPALYDQFIGQLDPSDFGVTL